MIPADRRRFLPAALVLILLSSPLFAADAAPVTLLDLSGAGAEKRMVPTDDQVTVIRSEGPASPAVVVTIKPGQDGYPGVDIKPISGPWDLSKHDHVEARITNTGTTTLRLGMRVDNAGDWHVSPWNTEQIALKPGQSGTIRVMFGYAYGHQRGFALNPAAVVNIKFFVAKVDIVTSFRIESLVAAGPVVKPKAPDPDSIRVKPVDGVILGKRAVSDVLVLEGRDTKPWSTVVPHTPAPDVSLRVVGPKGLKTSLMGQTVHLLLPVGKASQSVLFKPAEGLWDLRAATEIRIRVMNDGTVPISVGIQAFSKGGQTAAISAPSPLPPKATEDLVVPFAAATPAVATAATKPGYYGCEKGTGTTFASDVVSGIQLSCVHEAAASLSVLSITADAPAATLPSWLGKRPPVDGDWVQTLDENFDGSSIDLTRWNIYGPNYWDKATHWSKDDLILGGGVVKLHFEKKKGFDNDDPQGKPQNLTGVNSSDYACGFLTTYGKWTQRYGYFEARLKLPDVPGLWPTFWMMPDRGAAAGTEWIRQDTGNGAMEMDIMEHLTRWGPHRYNIADHWNGYGKDHVSSGSTNNYVSADPDGFITCGLLWTPGSVVYYGNGKELLRMESPRISTVPSYLIFEMTTGGWDNDTLDDARLPVDYVIDYVRCWQRKDLASAADHAPPMITPSGVPPKIP